MREKPLKVSYARAADELTIDGMRYAGALFRALGGPVPVRQWFQVIARTKDGVITVKRAPGALSEEIKRLEDNLRSAECVVRQIARDTYGRDMSVKEYADAAGYDS